MALPPKIVELAIKYGMIREGYTFEYYLILAVLTRGYETVAMWGVQGSGKSTRMLQIKFWIIRFLYTVRHGYITLPEGEPRKWPYKVIPELVDASHKVELDTYQKTEIWEEVLSLFIFKPTHLVERLEGLEEDEVLPSLGWDDVLIHYPSSKFKTDIKQYEAVDEVWAAIRTGVSVVIVNLPIINRLAKNIKDNVSFEVFISRNQFEMIKRIFYLPGMKGLDANLFKVTVEEPSRFDLYAVPEWVWKRYWYEMRLPLTREAISTLKGVTDMESLEGYVSIIEAVKVCKENGVNWGASTIQQNCSRGVLIGQKIGGELRVERERLMAIIGVEILIPVKVEQPPTHNTPI